MALADFLQQLLRQPQGPQNALAQAASAQGSAGPNGSAAYQTALQAAFQGQGAPQAAPQDVSPMQTGSVAPQAGNAPMAAPAPSGGGNFGEAVGGFLQNLIDPQARGRNQTIDWLQRQGLDQGTATLLAGDKGLLRQYLGGRIAGPDPEAALKREKLGLEVQNLKNPTTDDIREYQFAKNQGYNGSFTDFMQSNREAGATNINLPGQPNIGTIPQGYEAIQNPDTKAWTFRIIPGGPADKSAKDALTEQNKATSTEIITNAADTIRKLSKETGTTGLVGAGVSYLPNTDAAEVYRQVDVLKANAKSENLNAMRQASPTGGALGNVSNQDIQLLADKAGALDPKSNRFPEQLDDYERTLLRIVHGKDAGDKIYEETRKKATSADDLAAMPAPEGIDPNVWKFVPPEKRKLWAQ